MSHNNSKRQLSHIGRNNRSVWIQPAYLVTAKNGIRVVATAAAETRAEALQIAEAFALEHKADQIIDQT